MNWADFYPYVLPQALGVAEPVADFHIREAVITFCRRTLCYTATTDALLADGKGTVFDIEAPMNTEVVKILAARLDGRNYTLVDTQRGQRLLGQRYAGEFLFNSGAGTFTVNPAPQAGAALVLDLALMPDRRARGVESDAVDAHMADIAKGALATLLLQPGQPYSNAGLAGVNHTQFEQRIATTAMAIARGQASAKLGNATTYF